MDGATATMVQACLGEADPIGPQAVARVHPGLPIPHLCLISLYSQSSSLRNGSLCVVEQEGSKHEMAKKLGLIFAVLVNYHINRVVVLLFLFVVLASRIVQ